MAWDFLTVSLGLVVGVRDVPSQVEVEGFLVVSLDEGEGFLGQSVMGVSHLLGRNVSLATVDIPREPFLGLVAVEMFGVVIMGFALIEVAVKEIKALFVGMSGRTEMTQSPLPDSSGFVTGLLEQGGYGDRAFGQDVSVIACNGGVSGVLAGEKNQAGGSAYGVPGVVVGEA